MDKKNKKKNCKDWERIRECNVKELSRKKILCYIGTALPEEDSRSVAEIYSEAKFLLDIYYEISVNILIVLQLSLSTV